MIADLSQKTLQKRMEMFLKVFAAVTSPKQLYQHPLLYAFYNVILSKPDVSITRLALDCIITFKSESVMLYVDNLRRLLDDSLLRNEIATFDISEKGGIVQATHRSELIPLVIRLVYGRFASRSRSSKAARDQSIARYH